MALQPSASFDITSIDFTQPDLLNVLLSQESVSAQTNVLIKKHLRFLGDIPQLMDQLAHVGEWLQLVYAGSLGFNCASKVVPVICDYQSLIKVSIVTTAVFEKNVIRVLKMHATASEEAGNLAENNLDEPLKRLIGCREIANEMSQLAGSLRESGADLSAKCKTAITASIYDETILCERENANHHKICGLEVAVKLLGRMRIIFEKQELFWGIVGRFCDYTPNIETLQVLADCETKDDFLKEVQFSAVRWVAIGKICQIINEKMVEVSPSVAQTLSILPSSTEEARSIIEEGTDRVLTELAIEMDGTEVAT